jgi:DNA-binding MarR family transcriptional regulator
MDSEYIKSFRDILRKFEREIFFQNTESCCKGVTLAQCHTLLEIEKEEKISVTELANNLSLDKSTISRTVDGLVNIGLVERVIPSDNRRMAILSLTGTGRKTCRDINLKSDKYVSDNLSGLSVIEQKELLRLFKKLTNNMIFLRANNLSENQNPI